MIKKSIFFLPGWWLGHGKNLSGLCPMNRANWQLRAGPLSVWTETNCGLKDAAEFGDRKRSWECQPAELIISPLAGKSSTDASGNNFFHHYFENDQLLESDINVAYKK